MSENAARHLRLHERLTIGAVVRGFIFDGDDTLWLTEALYDAARARARQIVERAGLDGERWEALERQIDVDNVATMGHQPDRFPRSCVQAYEVLCHEAGRDRDAEVATAIASAASGVFDRVAPLRGHAKKVLTELHARGARLALLTKGDRAVQERRIRDSGLAQLFDVIEIVDAKTPERLRQLAHRMGLAPDAVVSVGNSIRSDVLPSIEAGLHAIWIPAHVWEYERAHDHLAADELARIQDLDELLDLLP